MFKPGITAKLFFAILTSSVLVAMAMGMASRLTFNRGFLGYLNDQGIERMEALLPALASTWQAQGGWHCFRESPRQWFRLMRPGGLSRSSNQTSTDGGCGNDDGDRDRQAPAVASPPAPRTPGPPPPQSDLTGVSLRLALLDEQRQFIAGNPQVGADALLRPIQVDGRTVGWVALVPFENVSTLAAQRFAQQQLWASWVIGALAIVLAALVAVLLARVFLAPLKRIARGTHALAAGHYDERVEAGSGDELGQLAEDFNRLAHALKQNEKMRRAFMADVSHELRTPLSVLRGELEALEDGVRALTPESIRSLQAETAILGKLVNDLYELSLADVGALSYRMSDSDVIEVLRDAVHPYRERLAQQDITLELHLPDPPVMVLADEGRLGQLLGNLLENSLRYTDAGGRLRLEARIDGKELLLQFDDSAPGVAEDALPKLFDRFYRVETSRNRATGGAGLGLAISAKIAEAHGGSLSAAASPLGGLRLSLRLPLAVPGI
ncbi:sensor histidine kinase efflux regulator BaeS [uncultured Nevskia sp.]|uniref:sensor histidine kinase efflux regulator BaeS n=1 Tax=uncultured Nevskia sp. TaxID=228950 RepID=UPI0025EEE7F4|nr:sensor histidine kinase efflux regulator BaeS [uncultured Nevskia sp.]